MANGSLFVIYENSKISITTSIARAKGDLSMIFELTALVDEILLPDMIKSIQNKKLPSGI